jgi:predicted ester cyclase
MFAEGDRVAARCTMTGTHKGEFMSIPPTSKAFRIDAFDILRFGGGKVAEHWGITDQAAMM